METIPEEISLDKEFESLKQTLTTVGMIGVLASMVGFLPRIGLSRAAWIALRSRFAFKPVPESIRAEEVKFLRERLSAKDFGHCCVVVTGKEGIGKACLIETATSKIPGVINISVASEETSDEIVKGALRVLSRLYYSPPFESAKRVVFWHRLITFGKSPIIAINTTDRSYGRKCTEIRSAVRTLVED